MFKSKHVGQCVTITQHNVCLLSSFICTCMNNMLNARNIVGRDSSVGVSLIAGWTVRGSYPAEVEIFHACPDGSWGPPSLLCIEYRGCCPGVKRPERGVNHLPPSSAEVKERVELYLYSPSWPSWPFIRRTLPFCFFLRNINNIKVIELLIVEMSITKGCVGLFAST